MHELEGEGEREGAVCGHDPSQGKEGRPSLHPQEHFTTVFIYGQKNLSDESWKRHAWI